ADEASAGNSARSSDHLGARDALGFGPGHLQALEGLAQKLGHHQVAVPLSVRRDDVPRGPVGGAPLERELVGALVLVPELALVDVALVELPALRRLVDARLEPLALLVLR